MFTKDVSGLVINTDESHYKSIIARRKQHKKIDKLESDLCCLTAELQDIKSLLKDILNGKNHG